MWEFQFVSFLLEKVKKGCLELKNEAGVGKVNGVSWCFKTTKCFHLKHT